MQINSQNTKRNPQEDRYKFEVFVIDTNNKTAIREESNVINYLLSNSDLWKEQKSDGNKINFDGGTCRVSKTSKSEDFQNGIYRGFIITIVSSFAIIEPIRKIIVQHLKDGKFDKIYILEDTLSRHIATKLYPLIYDTENALRRYSMKFFVTKYGASFWDNHATKEWRSKAGRENETVFTKKLIENQIYLIDFPDVGQLIYELSSFGNRNQEDLRTAILKLEETPQAIKRLKDQVETNYTKFFEKSFKDKNFKEKWEKLFYLRNKVAHNSLFELKDLELGQSLCKDLQNIISEADKEITNLIITDEELEAIQINITEELKVISEDLFLEKLKEREEYFAKTGGFVGLRNFITNHLAAQKFDIKTSFEVFNSLLNQDKVETYEIQPGPYTQNVIKGLKITKL